MSFDPNRPFEAGYADYKAHVSPSMADLLGFMGFESVEHHAVGARVYDAEGVEYIDCLGGFGVMSLGHCSVPVAAAVREGKSETEEFAGSIGRGIPLASKMGMEFGEVAGMMAAIAYTGAA